MDRNGAIGVWRQNWLVICDGSRNSYSIEYCSGLGLEVSSVVGDVGCLRLLLGVFVVLICGAYTSWLFWLGGWLLIDIASSSMWSSRESSSISTTSFLSCVLFAGFVGGVVG